MMILPLANTLQECFQNLTSRIAGVDNEQITNKVFGTGGAMLGFGLGAIKEQFKIPKHPSNSSNSGTNTNSNNGLQGLISRAKSFINPVQNLTDEKDYNGNVNPIRNTITSTDTDKQRATTQKSGINNINRKITPKSIAKNIASASLKGTKTYLSLGAKMAEGNSTSYKHKKSMQNTEYLNNTNYLQKGAENEFEEKSEK